MVVRPLFTTPAMYPTKHSQEVETIPKSWPCRPFHGLSLPSRGSRAPLCPLSDKSAPSTKRRSRRGAVSADRDWSQICGRADAADGHADWSLPLDRLLGGWVGPRWRKASICRDALPWLTTFGDSSTGSVDVVYRLASLSLRSRW